jgi:hypothetical protein
MSTTRLFLIGLIFAAAFPTRAQDVALQAGIARVEITPSTMMRMAGYPNRTCTAATGKLDPLNAKALVLATGDQRVALVTVDLINMVSNRLRTEVASKLGIPVLLLASSHTHSGPSFGRSSQAEAASPYVTELEDKIFAAIQEASRKMFPARLSVGRGSLQIGYNRLIPGPDGRAQVLHFNRDAIPYGPVDPEYMLLRVEDESGATRALLVHYACHAVVLRHINCQYSADYPGILQAKLESQLSGAQVMFVQGGAGDINPILEGRSEDSKQNYDVAVRVGEALAAAVLQTAKAMPVGKPNRYPILSTSEMLTFSNRRPNAAPLRVGITTLLINREIAIAAVPGEPMHKLQEMWKKGAEVPYPLFWGYTYSSEGDWPGYIPDLRTAAHGGYGADSSIEIGAGETIMQRHLKNLYSLQGMWQQPRSGQ